MSLDLKPEPVTVIVNAGPPAVTILGVVELITGPARTLNAKAAVAAPDGFATVMLAVVAAVRSAAGIVADS